MKKIFLSIVSLSFFLVLLFGAVHTTFASFHRDLVGQTIDMNMLTDTNGSALKVKNRSVIHIYTNQCPSCLKDKHTFSTMNLKNKVDLIGLKWSKRSNPDNPGVYSRIALAKNSDLFVELGMKIVPLTLIVEQNGKILYSHVGKLEKSIVEDEIIPVVNAK